MVSWFRQEMLSGWQLHRRGSDVPLASVRRSTPRVTNTCGALIRKARLFVDVVAAGASVRRRLVTFLAPQTRVASGLVGKR